MTKQNFRMNNKKNTTIYFDPDLTSLHNPDFGSLEYGQRVNIDLSIYRNKQCRIICYQNLISDKNTTKQNNYFKILKSTHQNNPIFKYISSISFEPNFFQKKLKMKPSGRKIRNCHGCTSETIDDICSICQSNNSDDNFFRYAHLIDKNISESDTTYFTHNSYTAIKRSVILVCQMIDDLINGLTKNGFAFVRPPGHHASNDKSEGFCLINNVAVCANYALKSGFKKIFIFDFDVHHGNGTQEIFYHRNDVYYCSIHTLDAYPRTGYETEIGAGKGKHYNRNIVVPKLTDDNNYLRVFYSFVLPIIVDYHPDIILVSAGFDGLNTDPMAIMNLTPECYGEITKDLVSCGIPVLMILEGGYNIADMLKCCEICIDNLIS